MSVPLTSGGLSGLVLTETKILKFACAKAQANMSKLFTIDIHVHVVIKTTCISIFQGKTSLAISQTVI